MAAKRQAAGDIGNGDGQHNHHPDSPRNTEQRAGANQVKTGIAELWVAGKSGEGFTARGQHGGPAQDVHGAQGADKRRDVVAGDNPAITSANQPANQQHQWHNHPHTWKDSDAEHRQHNTFGYQPTGNHAAQPERCANRQINARRDDDKGDAECQKGVDGNVFNHDHQAAHGEEIRHHDGEEADNQKQRNKGAEFEQ